MNKLTPQETHIIEVAICENVSDTTARRLVRWVTYAELNSNMETLHPSNSYLAERLPYATQEEYRKAKDAGKVERWSDATIRNAVYLAKKSQFITTTGSRKSRTFELNKQFLKGKMGEILARNQLSNDSFLNEIHDMIPDKLPDKVPDKLPDKLPDVEQGLYLEKKYIDTHTSSDSEIGVPRTPRKVPSQQDSYRSDSLASQRSSAKSSKQESLPTASFYDFEQEHSDSNFSELATQASPKSLEKERLGTDNIKIRGRSDKIQQEARELLAKVVEIVKPGSKLTAKRVSAMKARLNDYTPEEIIEAAKWFKADDWRQSAESRAKGWNSVDYLIRPSGMQRYGEMGKFNKQTTQESNLARINRLMKAQRS